MIKEIALSPKQSFWIMTINLLIDNATMEWCKVFGSWEEDTHWTKIIPEEDHEAVRIGLCAAVGMDVKQWSDYRTTIVNYRNEAVAHHDLNPTVSKYPNFDTGILAANYMFDQIRKLCNAQDLGGIPTSLNNWSVSVANNMSCIVKKAFEASAALGSNVRSQK